MALNPYETPQGKLRARAESTRRQFLLIMGTLAGVGSLVFGSFKLLGFMFPAATNEAPPQFKTTFTVDDLTGGIDPATKKARLGANVSGVEGRVNVILDDAGIYAVYLVCTHLGCTPNYTSNVVSGSGVAEGVADKRGVRTSSQQKPNGWACPCHGSRYFIDSTNFYGPAPRPMDWVDITIAPDNHFVVDRSSIVVYRQAGDITAPEWRLDPATGQSNGKTIGV